MSRALSTLAIWTLLFGCEVRKHKSEDEPPTKDPAMTTPSIPATTLTREQVSELRAAVIAGSTLLDRPELTPTDPAIVDRFVIKYLPEGKFPATPRQREDCLWHASTGLTNWLSREEDGLAYLTKRVEERYAKPVITRDGDLVRVDAGVVPGTFGVRRAHLQILLSPLIVRGELIASEVARLLMLGMAQYPDAQTYQVEVDIPATSSTGLWTYRYDRAEDAIRMYAADWPEEYYVTGKIGGKVESVTTLYHMDLTTKPLDRRPIRSTELANKLR